MGKAKSTRKNVKKKSPTQGMVSKPAGPANSFGKTGPGGMNQNFASTKKKGGFSVTPRKAS